MRIIFVSSRYLAIFITIIATILIQNDVHNYVQGEKLLSFTVLEFKNEDMI